MNSAERAGQGGEVDVVVIGAGFAGLAMANRLQENGFSMQGFEAGGDVGGTWYWNRYPGARCDVQSMEYSYRFSEDLQQQWEWSEHFSPQPEILRYAGHVADRFDLRRHFRFHTRVLGARFDEARGRWIVATSDGAETVARFLVTAVGCLSASNVPDIAGLDSFQGLLVHTGSWPHEGVDLAGKRVGVIGTGSSGVQAIPMIAREAAELTVFQRTASYCVPAHNRPLDPADAAKIKSDYKAFRDHCGKQFGAVTGEPGTKSALEVDDAERKRIYEEAWARGGLSFQGAFYDLSYDMKANDTASAFFRDKIHEIVKDPETADKLVPKHRLGVKRLCIDTGYYDTYNRPNVHLVDLKQEPIERVTETGVRAGGKDHPLDILVLATGYDAITGPLLRMDIRGRGDRRLRDDWADGAQSYLGLGVAGFPNMFIVSGPGSPCVLTNMIYSIEQHVDWIADCLVHLRTQGLNLIEADETAQETWGEELNAMAAGTLLATGNSWYTGANIDGKPRRFMIHLDYPAYVGRCEKVAAEGYSGFTVAP
ncbi:flavin-containing monooxygenase [Flavisphingomonas formosensis]|uniref:flavin-containing monooxygenase n=1 Tax=Flavisphingomonas formosensis TaxID=861534 RepID=UPI0012F92009|nr:NAD(P)/FAD-dependent oxidoreductase [Sphingomonas formosensis]